MSTPFDDLPALTRPAAATAPASAFKREREDKEEQEQEQEQQEHGTAAPETKKKPRREQEEKEGTEEKQPTEQERTTATKKPRREQERADDDHNDPVAAALARLTPHLRSSARIGKAGPLLRQLLDGDGAAVAEPRHAPLSFAAVAAAFADPAQFLAAPLAARVEYARVARSAQRAAAAGLFAGEQEEELGAATRAFFSECAAAWAQLRLELLSAEDSFALSKALGKVKALVDGLPEWQEGDEVEEAEEEEERATGATAPAPAPAPPPPPAPPPAAAAKPLPPPPLITWPPSPARVLLLRRRAALDCALCARDHVHGRAGAPWAAAAVEPALEHVASAAASARFAPGMQRREAQALAGWVSARRAARRTGVGGAAGAAVDDRGAFERARASFARMGDVSARGSVGNKGGASLPWLG